MALKHNKATFLVVSLVMIAALLEGSTAQSTAHVVGDAMGWIVPPGGATVYSNWAANNTFKVNDVLVFNFATGRHDVTQVTKAAFDACNTTSPISKQTNGPANITLTAGEHYYICTVPTHCTGGQKLAINVTSGASSPAPTPTPTPTPAAPTPTPTSSPPPTPTQTPAPTPTTSSPPPPPTPTPTSSPPPSPTTPTPTPTSSPTATPSSPSPNGGDGTTPPPSGNSAKSLGVALSSTFLAIFVALLY